MRHAMRHRMWHREVTRTRDAKRFDAWLSQRVVWEKRAKPEPRGFPMSSLVPAQWAQRAELCFPNCTICGTVNDGTGNEAHFRSILQNGLWPGACARMADGAGAEDRKTVGTDIKDVEFGWPVGKPLAASLGRGLWEVRCNIRAGIARVIFYVTGNQMILLHGFVKKNQKTPKPDRDLGFKRMKEHLKERYREQQTHRFQF
jgi:phage-related protein